MKTPSNSVFEAAVHKQINAVQYLLASAHMEPNFLAFESFPWLQDVSKWHVFDEPQPQFSLNESRKLKLPANDENLARKLPSSIKNKFMMLTQIHYCGAVVMLTDVQAYCVTFFICLFRPAFTSVAIYQKTVEEAFPDTPEKNRYSISICIAHVDIDAPIYRIKSIDILCIDTIFYNIICI